MARVLFAFVALALVACIFAEPAGYGVAGKGAPGVGYAVGVGPGLGAKGVGYAAGPAIAAGGAAIPAPVPGFAGPKGVAYKGVYGR